MEKDINAKPIAILFALLGFLIFMPLGYIVMDIVTELYGGWVTAIVISLAIALCLSNVVYAIYKVKQIKKEQRGD